MYRQYPSEERPYSHAPGERFWAAGFRVSDPPSKIVRNMPPTLVEFTCGGRDVAREQELRKTGKYAGWVAPVGPDGEPMLKKTSTYNDLRFFLERPDAESAYADELEDAMNATDRAIEALENLKRRIAGFLPSSADITKPDAKEETPCC